MVRQYLYNETPRGVSYMWYENSPLSSLMTHIMVICVAIPLFFFRDIVLLILAITPTTARLKRLTMPITLAVWIGNTFLEIFGRVHTVFKTKWSWRNNIFKSTNSMQILLYTDMASTMTYSIANCFLYRLNMILHVKIGDWCKHPLFNIICLIHSVNKSSAPQDPSSTQLLLSTVHAWVVTEWPLQCLH